MPDRKTHLYYAYRMIRELNLRVPQDAPSIIQSLIDYPRRLPEGFIREAYEKCPSPLFDAWKAGMRIPGYGAHDWQRPKGRLLLKRLVECLYGPDAVLLVDLHFALDDVWEGRTPEGYDPRVLRFALATDAGRRE